LGLKPVTTPVTSLQSNGMAESFVKTLKRDNTKLAERPDSQTVMAQLPKRYDDYNSSHLHSALRYLPSKLFWRKTSGILNIPTVLGYLVKTNNSVQIVRTSS
jgi:putative transposase